MRSGIPAAHDFQGLESEKKRGDWEEYVSKVCIRYRRSGIRTGKGNYGGIPGKAFKGQRIPGDHAEV